MKRIQGWDLDAFLTTNPQFQRVVELFCYLTLLFNAWWITVVFWNVVGVICEAVNR